MPHYGGTLTTLAAGSLTFELRKATAQDLRAIVALLAADQLGTLRDAINDDTDLTPYQQAFETIDADAAHLLVIAEVNEIIAGTLQLSFLPGLARRGALRAQIEAVRVNERYRNTGLGTGMFEWAIGEARRRGCTLVQLTTDKTRTDAGRFYERLGFIASHEGLKLQLSSGGDTKYASTECPLRPVL